MDRRAFLKKSTLLASSFPLFHIGQAWGASPNSKIKHASIGVAGQGEWDIQGFATHPLFELVAVADVDANALEAVKVNYPNVRVYRDWRDLLAKEKDLDSVNIATPDHMHAPISVSAMNLGLHVYCQKPLAQNLYETRRMAEIASEKGVVTQMGIQLASTFYERVAVELIRSDFIGKVREVHVFSHKQLGDVTLIPDRTDPVPSTLNWDLWCGSREMVPYLEGYYHPFQWRKRLKFGTGCLGDMGCHLLSPSFRSLGLRTPLSIRSTGESPNRDNYALNERFEFVFEGNEWTEKDTLPLTWTDGQHRPSEDIAALVGGVLPDQGNVFVGTDGVLLAPHAAMPIAYPREKYEGRRFPKLAPKHHYRDFLDSVRDGTRPIADFASYSGKLTEAVLLGGIASRFPNTRLDWDGPNLKFLNAPYANAYIHTNYRKGWEVEGLL